MKEQIIQFYGITDYTTFDKYMVVTGTNAKDKPTLQIYNTKAKLAYKAKVAGFYFFSVAERDEYLKKFMARIQYRLDQQAERKAARASFVNPAKVGDILDSSWGYEQTNIDFYEVIEVKGKSIVIREISQEKVGGGHWMTGTCTPRPGHFKGEPMTKFVRPHYSNVGYSVSVNGFAIATLWDGKPQSWTAYA
jgi:hypothetical protein